MIPDDDTVDKDKSEKGMSTGILLIDEINKKTSGDIPIIVLSARQDLQWLVDNKKVEYYLRKPVSPDEVTQAIEKVLRR